MWEYFRQIFWGTGIDLPEEDFVEQMEEFTIDAMELGPGEKAQLSLNLPADFVIVFEPVTHFAHFIDVKGEPTKERQNLSLIFNKAHSPTVTTEMRPGPLRITHGQQERRARAAVGVDRRRITCTTCSASGGRS